MLEPNLQTPSPLFHESRMCLLMMFTDTAEDGKDFSGRLSPTPPPAPAADSSVRLLEDRDHTC